MSGHPTSPLLEPRDAAAFARETLARLPAYVPGWRPTPGDAGNAVVQVYARYLKSLADRINKAPDKHKLAFLDMLGVELLPAQAARAPMVFTAIPAVGDSRVPERTRVGAKIDGQTNPLIFETDEAIALAAAQISQVVTLWPGRDAYADHTAAARHGDSFTLFEPLAPMRHELYLSHDRALALDGRSTVELHVELGTPGTPALAPVWEYWDGVAWRMFKAFKPSGAAATTDSVDGTTGLTRSGVIRLVADCATTAKSVIDGVDALWIRARLAAPLVATESSRRPEIERIALNSVIDRTLPAGACATLGDAIGIVPQAAYASDQKLDLTKAVQVLGPHPQIGSAFWVQCDEAFVKPGAEVTLCFRKIETPEEKADKQNAKFEVDVAAAELLVVNSATLDAWTIIRIANAVKILAKTIPDVVKYDQAVADVAAARDALKDPSAPLGINGIDALEKATAKLVLQMQTVVAGLTFPLFAPWNFTWAGFNPFWVINDISQEMVDFFSINEKRIQDSFVESFIAAEDVDSALSYLAQLTPTSAAMAAGATLPSMDAPVVRWEYWNGSAWRSLPVNGTTNARTFQGDGPVTFTVPDDIDAVDHAGTTARWIRARLVSGGYGLIRVVSWKDQATGKLNYFPIVETRPPTFDRVQLGYLYRSSRVSPEHCRSLNDFAFANHDVDVRTMSTTFEPFALVADTTPALYLGFDAPLPADQIGIFLDIEEVIGETDGPALLWEYYDGAAWSAVRVTDETHSLALPGMAKVLWPGVPAGPSAMMSSARASQIQLDDARAAAAFAPGDRVLVSQKGNEGEIASVAAVSGDTLELETPLAKSYARGNISLAPLARFGTPAFWLRGRLAHDAAPRKSRVNGVHLNAVWASQLQTIENETLGASNGEPDQVFFFRNVPVLEGETIEVRELEGARARVEEPILREELAKSGVPDSDIRTVRDARTGDINEVWVTWHEEPNLFFASSTARVFTIERSRGRLLFGGAGRGLSPVAAPDNIVARRYRTGGGTAGNVSKGAITQLLAGVLASKVTNPRAAEGGADGQPIEDVLARGSAVVHHRRQAITSADFESLARDASPAVAVARALPTTHPSGRFAPGWVTVLIVPRSNDPQPLASFELRQRVQRFLAARAPAAIATHISVIPAKYFPVGVTVSVSPLDAGSAGTVVRDVTSTLARFLHPLTGGPDGEGWPFGRDIYLSDVAAAVESVSGVDFATSIALLVNGTPVGERVAVPADRIVVAGVVRVTLFGGEG